MNNNTQGRKFRVRIVEKSRQAVRDLIGTGYPWSYEKCDKDDCAGKKVDIRKRRSRIYKYMK